MITVHSWAEDGRCKHCMEPRGESGQTLPRWCPRKPPTCREAARRRWPLDGAEAQALEAALSGVDKLLRELLADIHVDGGQHAIDVGLETACRQAHVRIASMRALRWRVAANAGRTGTRKPRWSHVKDATGYGSTSSADICRQEGFDPDELVGATDE